MSEKYADRQTRHVEETVEHNDSAVSTSSSPCQDNQGLLSEVLSSGFTIFGIDKAGAVQRAYGTSHELIGKLDIWDDAPQRSRIQPKWNWRLWACVDDGPGQTKQVKLIELLDGYAGVVAWSNEQPDVLEVALIGLDHVGVTLDPAWESLIFKGRLDQHCNSSGLDIA